MERIFYRYLVSHWLETLRNCWFKVAQPSKYWENWSLTAASDPLECKPQILVDAQSPFLNRFKVDNATFANNFNNAFKMPETMDSTVRILCLSDPSRRPGSDLHMWYRYGGRFSGVRIGIKLSIDEEGVCNLCRRFRGEYVEYAKSQNIIRTSDIANQNDLSELCFNVIFKKSTKFKLESEYRLLTVLKFCKSKEGLDFLPLDKDMIVSVDIGFKMPNEEKAKLLQFCKRNFNLDSINEAKCAGRSVEYKDLYNQKHN